MTHPTIERPRIRRKHRNQMQRRADSALVDHRYQLELVGGLGAVDWPSICASCGAETGERLDVRKVFVRPRTYSQYRRAYRRQVIASAQIPYCASCATRHRALVPPRSLLGDAWRMLWPVLIPMAGAGYFFLLTLRIAIGEQVRGDLAFKYVWGLPALFGFILVWCLVVAWHSSRALRVEKQTEVTRACDFSDDVSWFWERERRIYSMRDERFARAFADANADRVWSADDDRRSSRRMVAGLAVVGIAGAVVWAVVVLAPI